MIIYSFLQINKINIIQFKTNFDIQIKLEYY